MFLDIPFVGLICLEEVGILCSARMKICVFEPFPPTANLVLIKKYLFIMSCFEGLKLSALHRVLHILRTKIALGSERNR